MKTFSKKTHLLTNFSVKTFLFILLLNQAQEDLSSTTALAFIIASAGNLLVVSLALVVALN